MSENSVTADEWSPRKLSHEQARTEQRAYWLSKTMAERLAAMTELTKRLYRMRGIDLDEQNQISLLAAPSPPKLSSPS